MKKLISLVLAFALVFSVCSIASAQVNTPDDGNMTQSSDVELVYSFSDPTCTWQVPDKFTLENAETEMTATAQASITDWKAEDGYAWKITADDTVTLTNADVDETFIVAVTIAAKDDGVASALSTADSVAYTVDLAVDEDPYVEYKHLAGDAVTFTGSLEFTLEYAAE